eukprot:TRINITY_DN1051_c0_g1_i2.p1 TRINITY_DN1051_c0_g1~~TRINITY_DN1051_c0_g1_i2.p1  ORF type:complete len:238 (-),score=18.66 TRINITY_DN1051_c0_g1_i2:206-919(-)
MARFLDPKELEKLEVMFARMYAAASHNPDMLQLEHQIRRPHLAKLQKQGLWHCVRHVLFHVVQASEFLLKLVEENGPEYLQSTLLPDVLGAFDDVYVPIVERFLNQDESPDDGPLKPALELLRQRPIEDADGLFSPACTRTIDHSIVFALADVLSVPPREILFGPGVFGSPMEIVTRTSQSYRRSFVLHYVNSADQRTQCEVGSDTGSALHLLVIQTNDAKEYFSALRPSFVFKSTT